MQKLRDSISRLVVESNQSRIEYQILTGSNNKILTKYDIATKSLDVNVFIDGKWLSEKTIATW